MYRNFFSLSDLPFSISPDPKYLFMSDRHKEALAHLTYGLGESGGFALLTGEVGTGKTTISRCLMEQLPENTQTAFILNPTLSSRELLATLCDELKIRYRKTDASLKILTDKISEKLLKNHQNDINTLLIIDEAQHLQPEVLEQLRLLTNLETNTKKLLQVILIGQPELQQLLQRRDLRQLAQRITARYHLMPLTKEEINQYIAHRLSIADCSRALFNQRAISKIHQCSGGIPRLINLLCHSALMIAYNQNDSVVNKKIVMKAAEHALGNNQMTANNLSAYQPASHITFNVAAALSLVAIVSVVALSAFLWGRSAIEQPLDTIMVKTKSATPESEQVPTLPIATVNSDEAKLKQSDKQLQISADKPVVQEVTLEQQVVNQKAQLIEENEEKQLIKEPLLAAESESSEVAVQPEELEEISDELLTLFQAAVDETAEQPSEIEAAPKQNDELSPSKDTSEQVKSLTQMPVWVQNGVPSLTFEQHIYSSDGQGWVNVNGRDRYEGDMVAPELQVNKILPQQVILTYRGEKFSLPALANW